VARDDVCTAVCVHRTCAVRASCVLCMWRGHCVACSVGEAHGSLERSLMSPACSNVKQSQLNSSQARVQLLINPTVAKFEFKRSQIQPWLRGGVEVLGALRASHGRAASEPPTARQRAARRQLLLPSTGATGRRRRPGSTIRVEGSASAHRWLGRGSAFRDGARPGRAGAHLPAKGVEALADVGERRVECPESKQLDARAHSE
jgi:hypothetical protein